MPSKSRCKTCYGRERLNHPAAKSVEIKKLCANPTNGCVVCMEYVCIDCWPIHVEAVERKRYNSEDKTRSRAKPRYSTFRSGSVVMESLFATNGTNWDEFLNTKWEKKSRFFTYDADIIPMAKYSSPLSSTMSTASASSSSSTSIASTRQKNSVPTIYGGDGFWREASVNVFPLREIIRQSWHILSTLMGVGKNPDGTILDHIGNYCHRTMIEVSVHQNYQPKTRDEIIRLYGGDLYAAYLSGCSISWKNCELLSPHIAALCQDLQGEQDRKHKTERGGAFRQAYSTAHLIPSQYSETCPLNTNDRNVLIFQLLGRKYWKTSWSMPEDSSASQEKVVKSETTLLAPSSEPASKASSSFDGCLYPGDILYIPRGMSYQTQSQTQTSAQTKTTKSDEDAEGDGDCDPSMSFHITVALDEPDVLVADIPKNTVENSSPIFSDFPSSSNEGANIIAGPEILDHYNIALSRKRTLLIEEATRTSPDWGRARKHNPKKSGSMASSATSFIPGINVNPLDTVVGPTAASGVSYLTEIRASTRAEQKHGQERMSSRINEKWDAGIRSELRGVAQLIANGIRSFAPGDGRSIRHSRVVDMRDIVNDMFEDKSKVSLVCDLTLLALVKREVEAGNVAVVHGSL